MSRVFLLGVSGSGKSHIGTELSKQLGLPVIVLDDLVAPGGWDAKTRPRSPVLSRQGALRAELAKHDGWVVEGGYLWWTAEALEKADLIFWLDTPHRVALLRVQRRLFASLINDLKTRPGRAKLSVLRHPHILPFLRIAMEMWRSSRHRPTSAEGLCPPDGDKDEWSLDSVERVLREYRHKAVRVSTTKSADEVLHEVLQHLRALDAGPQPTR